MTKKRFYVILITLIGILIISGLIWYLFFRPSQPAPVGKGIDFTIPDKIAANKLKVISSGPVVSAAYNAAQGLVLFYDFSGQFWQSMNGETPTLIDQSLINSPVEVIWSKNLKNIVESGANQSDINHAFSDFTKRIIIPLKSNIKSLAFSPDSSKIVYYISDNRGINSLFTSDPDGKNQRALINSLKLRDTALAWPKINQISFTSKPSGFIAGSSWNLDMKNLIFTKTLNEFFGLETLWSPDGNNLLYSFTDHNSRNPKLAILDNKGSSKNLSNISTLIDKCAWFADSITIVCAIPASWPESLVLPDDYYKRISLTVDNIWKVNTQTGEKTLVSSDLGDITNILVEESENSLLFILRNNQFLYRLNL